MSSAEHRGFPGRGWSRGLRRFETGIPGGRLPGSVESLTARLPAFYNPITHAVRGVDRVKRERPMRMGLAPKLILSVTVIVVVVEGIFGFVNARIQEEQLVDEVIRGANRLSNTITSATWDAMLANHRESAYKVMRTIGRQEGVDRVRMFNKEGVITFSTGDDANHRVDLNAEACYVCHAAGEPLVRVTAPSRIRYYSGEDGTPLLGMITPIYNEPACVAAGCHDAPSVKRVLGVLDISLPLDRLEGEVAGIRLRAILVGAVSVLLITVFVMFLSKRFISRPVRELIGATKRVASLELEEPVEVRSRDEIGELGRSFNRMREHLLTARTEIEDFARNLELKVEERTAQLEATQQKLFQTDRLASLGRLAASVAHEINNPLSAVLNYGKLMQRLLAERGVPPERLADFRHYLAQAVTETSRAGRIVTDLLSFSRRAPEERTPQDLNEIVVQTMTVLAHKLELSGAVVKCELTEDLPRVPCDASRIQQVLTNLVLNAVDSMPGGGELSVSSRLSPDGEAVELRVEDTGEGIRPENLSRIFDPFFTTKQDGKGVGLGLAVVYGIVEAHGGSIDVGSEPGEGTCFLVRLPVAGESVSGGDDRTSEET